MACAVPARRANVQALTAGKAQRMAHRGFGSQGSTGSRGRCRGLVLEERVLGMLADSLEGIRGELRRRKDHGDAHTLDLPGKRVA